VSACTVVRPSGTPLLLYDSPHSGRYYPPDFESKCSRLELRRGEDAYVDELLAAAPALGATLLTGNYPRCYIDVNRGHTDIDAALLAEPWPHLLSPSDKSARGLGLIRRFVVPGVEAQARKLTVAEVQARIDLVYRPYHQTLKALVEEMLRERGSVLHVNWHSMKSVGNAMTPDGAGARRADFVVSDVRGASASSAVTELVVGTLRELGYAVTVNDPYTGGTIVQRTGAPTRGVHSIQLEINRALYLDEAAVERTPAFAALAAHLETFTRRLANAAASEKELR
jgi:N-formylglutamate deformylase